MELYVTIGALIGELILFGICTWQDRKPINPLRPRLLPYRLFAMFLIVIFLATLAHLIAMITGQPVQPRRRMGM